MKVLCICEHGNVRSVALAYLIKTIYGHEAIAIGIKTISDETWSMLCNWADKIIYVDRSVMGIKLLPPLKPGKQITKLDVGEDVWHNPFAQELQHKLLKHLKELNLT